MQVKWLNKALQNLDDEAEYIAKDDPAAARQLVQRIVAAVIHGTRELLVPKTRYIVPYRVRPRLQRIEILRVFHTSRRLPKHW